jgi:DNA gyrase subunit B
MDLFLNEEGTKSLKLFQLSKKSIKGKEVKEEYIREILNDIVELENLIPKIKRADVDIMAYLDVRKDWDKIPMYQLTIKGKTIYVENEKELIKEGSKVVSKINKKSTLDDILKEIERQKKDVKIVDMSDLTELRTVEHILKGLEAKGLEADEIFQEEAEIIEQQEKEDKKKLAPMFKVLDNDNKELLIFSIRELLEYIKKRGKEGLTIQRYKGLGEMNPEQLWETTMNPETRTLLQVTLEDAVKADNIFTILMGDEVAPRKEFIETHALEVKNLDI